MADGVVAHRLRHIERTVAGLLQPQRKVKVFGAKGIELHVEAAQLLEYFCAHHHGPTAGDAGSDGVILALIQFVKAHRRNLPAQEIDARTATVVQARPVVHKAQLGLHLPHPFVAAQHLVQGLPKARFHQDIVIQKE